MTIAAGLGSLPARLADRAIRAYQRYVSPHKGFRCAHRALHGGDSCSQHARTLLAIGGFMAGWRGMRDRFRACREAAAVLGARRAARAERVIEDEIDGPLDDPVKGGAARGSRWSSCPEALPFDCCLWIPGDAMGDACVGSGCDAAAGADCAGCACA